MRNKKIVNTMRSKVFKSDLPDQVETYIEDLLLSRDDVPAQVLAFHATQIMPKINVAPSQGKLLNLLVRMAGVKRVLEIGTLGGYSTVWMALGLPQDGHVTTIDFDERYVQIAHETFAMSGLADRISIRQGMAAEVLQQMVEEHQQGQLDTYDFIFIDADKENNPLYLEYCLQLSHSGTIIVADNVVRDGKLITETDKAPNIRGLRQYYQDLASNPALDSTAFQTVSTKGWDGLCITLVK